MSFLKRLFSGTGRVEKVNIEKRFRLERPIGKGTMSKVWRATDSKIGKVVALKVLDKEKTLKLEQRFTGLNRPREGEVAVTLQHPNIVRTFDHGITTKDEQFLVMEFIEGLMLSDLIKMQNDRMKSNCLSYCIQIGEALDYLHSQKWIHRDLCPRNILVTHDDVVKVMDFGLVVPNTPEFRRPGNRTGTAAYMAPELIKRQPTDSRIDIYSYAMTCFEMYTRQHPWPAADTLEAVLQHMNSPPKEIRNLVPNLDPRISAAIMKGLATDPNDRWQTAREMVSALQAAR